VAAKIEIESVRRKSLPRALLSRALARCGVAFYDMVLGEGDLEPERRPVAPMARIVVRVAEAEDLEHVGDRRTKERFACNASLDSRCVVALHESTVVGYAWFNCTVFEFLGQTLERLPSGTMCVHDVFVFPEHRGTKVLQQLLAEVFRLGLLARSKTAVCVVDKANAPAVAAFRRMGVQFRWAPILKLPGLKPVLLGMRSVRGTHA